MTQKPDQQPRDSLISAEENQAMFDGVAGRYDILNRMMSLGMDRAWRKKAVRKLAPQSGGAYLDIGAGTGDLSIEVVRQMPSATVIGIDPADQMRAIGITKVAKKKLSRAISFEAGDALALRFENNSFDGAVSGFCWRNIEDRQKAFEELLRVLKPGARAVVLELSKPTNQWVRWGHKLYNKTAVPVLGYLLSKGQAYTYLTSSIEAFPPSEAILSKMHAAGFEHTRANPLLGGVVSLFIGEKPR